MLKDGDDRWDSDKVVLEKMVLDYYSRLYSLEDVSEVWGSLPIGGLKL